MDKLTGRIDIGTIITAETFDDSGDFASLTLFFRERQFLAGPLFHQPEKFVTWEALRNSADLHKVRYTYPKNLRGQRGLSELRYQSFETGGCTKVVHGSCSTNALVTARSICQDRTSVRASFFGDLEGFREKLRALDLERIFFALLFAPAARLFHLPLSASEAGETHPRVSGFVTLARNRCCSPLDPFFPSFGSRDLLSSVQICLQCLPCRAAFEKSIFCPTLSIRCIPRLRRSLTANCWSAFEHAAPVAVE